MLSDQGQKISGVILRAIRKKQEPVKSFDEIIPGRLGLKSTHDGTHCARFAALKVVLQPICFEKTPATSYRQLRICVCGGTKTEASRDSQSCRRDLGQDVPPQR